MGDDHEMEYYGEERLASAEAGVPGWLKWSYIILPIWGVIWLILYWNGSTGWLDRGYWQQLERAANTTYPTQNITND